LALAEYYSRLAERELVAADPLVETRRAQVA
jgi:hypothetical protein